MSTTPNSTFKLSVNGLEHGRYGRAPHKLTFANFRLHQKMNDSCSWDRSRINFNTTIDRKRVPKIAIKVYKFAPFITTNTRRQKKLYEWPPHPFTLSCRCSNLDLLPFLHRLTDLSIDLIFICFFLWWLNTF